MFEISFWILLVLILYAYIGYTIILFLLTLFKRKSTSINPTSDNELPGLSFIVAVYNEADILENKIKNTLELNYPSEKLNFVFITDGSTDNSEEIISKYKNITLLHKPERQGKMAAINRAMKTITTPITIFSDANTVLHPDSLKWMVASLSEKGAGCVAGEKSIIPAKKNNAAGAGEGMYWRYESYIKKLESENGSTIGAAGELFGIKTELFEAPDKNTVVDDFVISLNIALKGHKIKYQPKAIATESASLNIKEEKKRKIRIAAGSFQVLFRMPELMNVFKLGMLSFQYISHKVLRWLVVPFSLPMLLIVNIGAVINAPENTSFKIILLLHFIFYLFVIIGHFLQKSRLRLKVIFIPYYVIVMNYTMILGFFRFLKGTQNAAWDKAKRES